jgi:hypothetical protein
VIAVDESGFSEGSLYLDDGITFNYTLGRFVHRRFTYNQGKLAWVKAEPEAEKSIPEFLSKARVTKLRIYDRSASTHVKVDFLVSEEWVWPAPKPTKTQGGGRSVTIGDGDPENKFETVGIILAVVTGILIFGIVGVLIWIIVLRARQNRAGGLLRGG